MIKNYLKVALRSIFRSKLTAFINIAGLALAMACGLLIALFIKDEWSYDRYHTKADRIYRLTRNYLSPDGSVNTHLGHVAAPIGPLLKSDFPDIEEVVRTLQRQILISYQEGAEEKKLFNEDRVFFAEPEIFKVFDIPLTEGHADRALNDPFHVILSEKTARKYFGDQNALGRSLRVDNQYNIEVSGVFRDFPAQSHWHPEILLSFSTLNDSTVYGRRNLEQTWHAIFSTYILLKEPFEQKKVESQFPEFLDKHIGALMGDPNAAKPSTWTTLFLQKLTDIHLHSNLHTEIEANGNITTVYMMGVIGLFIILIACFNFINLSTARATKRAKEVGLRKVAGAFRTQLITQYLSESILIAFFALVFSLGIILFALDWLNGFTGKSLSLDLSENAILFATLVGSTFLIGVFAGIYPAFVISSFKPATILKGRQASSAKGRAGLRQILVVAQFAMSIILIIATLITFEQLQYMNNRSLGYNKDQVVILEYYRELDNQYDAFYNELLKQSSIGNASRSTFIPTERLLASRGSAQVQLSDSIASTSVILKDVQIDHEFFDTYDVPFIAGRNFSNEIKSDDSLAFILNESAVAMIGLTPEQILSKVFQYGGVRGRVIGVVKNFHFESLHEPIVPIVFHAGGGGNLSIQVTGNKMQEALAHIEKVWKAFLSHRPFEYDFLSMQYAQLYNAEQKQGRLFIVFSGLAIFIASLGLFGLATFNTLQRIKEIGIRKVLGASASSIFRLLSKEIIVLIIFANIIAWPVAWYFTDQWLSSFAYRIDNNFFLYLFSAGAAIFIALITVSTQTFKAAMSNPADTLRNE